MGRGGGTNVSVLLLSSLPFSLGWFTPSSSSLFNASRFSAVRVCLSGGDWAQTTFVPAVLSQVELLPDAKANAASSSHSSPGLEVVVLRAEWVRVEQLACCEGVV